MAVYPLLGDILMRKSTGLHRREGESSLIFLVRLPPPPTEDILNGNHKQLRDGKGNAALQEPIETTNVTTWDEIECTDRSYLGYIEY